MRNSPFIRSCTYVTYFLSAVQAFSVIVGTPTQCDDLPVSWTGGQAPFEILVTPFDRRSNNISVPASAFSNGKGSYSTQLQLNAGTQFLLTMSDATGFGSGGTTTVLTVGAPVENNACNTSPPPQDFAFSTSPTIQQCTGYTFSDYGGAILPVTITGLVPGGTYFQRTVNAPSYTWVADVEEGTNLVFFMTDSRPGVGQGGTSNLTLVEDSTDASCLDNSSPSSTSSAPSQTSNQSNISTQSGGSKPSAGVIAGAAAGGGVVLVILIILGIRCIRKGSRSSDVMSSPKGPSRRLQRRADGHEVVQPEDGLLTQNVTSPHQTDRAGHDTPVQPLRLSNASTTDPLRQHIRQTSYTDIFAEGSSMPSASRRMAAVAESPDTFPHQTQPLGLARPVHPGMYSYQTNVSASNFAANDPHAPFNQTRPSRLSSNLDAFAGYEHAENSFIPPANRQTAAMAGQATSRNYTYPYQPRPVNHAAPPGQPRSLSHHASAGSFTVGGPRSQSNPSQGSRLSSNFDSFARHASAGSSSVSSASRQMAAMPGEPALPNPYGEATLPNPYGEATLPNPFPHQTGPVHFVPRNQAGALSHHTSASSFTISDRPSPLNSTQPSRLSSNMDSFARHVGPGSSSMSAAAAGHTATNLPPQIIRHTDMGDAPAAQNVQEVIELPPEYAERQVIPSEEPEPALAPNKESS